MDIVADKDSLIYRAAKWFNETGAPLATEVARVAAEAAVAAAAAEIESYEPQELRLFTEHLKSELIARIEVWAASLAKPPKSP